MTEPQFSQTDYHLRPEIAGDGPQIETMLDNAFGPGRFARTANRFREGVDDLSELAFVAVQGDRLIGSLRYWPVLIGGTTQALLLGPLVVDPGWQKKGCGLALMQHSLPIAETQGHRIVILVGDLPYYARAGFELVPMGRLDMPAPFDPRRLLWKELVPGACENVAGMIGKPLAN